MQDTAQLTLTCFACQATSTTTMAIDLDGEWVWAEHMRVLERAGWTSENIKNNPNVIRYCPTCSTKDA